MDKCYVELAGGLGNQLFQIAAGYGYSKKYNKELIVSYKYWTALQGTSPDIYKDTIFRNFKFGEADHQFPAIIEDEQYDTNLPHFEGDVLLRGYFQSLDYFKDVVDEFISLLEIPKLDVDFDVSVAFHIRRGDYIHLNHIFGVCGTNYFKRMFEKFKDKQINVFTDQKDFVLKEFDGHDYNLVTFRNELNEFAFMSTHDNIVCSNSSFSWWASLVGKKKESVYVPSKWFADGREHSKIYSNRTDFTLIDI